MGYPRTRTQLESEIRRLERRLRQIQSQSPPTPPKPKPTLEVTHLLSLIDNAHDGQELVGPFIQGLVSQLAAVGRRDILISGEAGTGKQLIGTRLHDTAGSGPIIRVDATRPDIEAVLLGGALELARGGTLLLRRVEGLEKRLQTRLHELLRDDIRLIATARSGLLDHPVSGALEGRLANEFHVPALRDRRSDIQPVAEHFHSRACADLGVDSQLSSQLRGALDQYEWPGNVSQMIQVMSLIAYGLTPFQTTLEEAQGAGGEGVAEKVGTRDVPQAVDVAGLTLEDVKVIERDVTLLALKRCGWRVSGRGGAAGALGIKPTTLASRMKRMGISRPRGDDG